MTASKRKTETDPNTQWTGVIGVCDPVIGIRIAGTNTEFLLPDKARIKIGAGKRCDITISSSFVSSLHCVLERQERGILLIDQGSKNGTRRGGRRYDRFEIEDGVMFMLGSLPLLPFGEKSQQTRRLLQRLVGFGEGAQHAADFFLRATRSDDHLLLVGEPGCRRAEIARLIHTARNTPGPFVEMTESANTGAEQVALLKSCQHGTMFLHQAALPDDSQVLIHTVQDRTFKVRLIAAATPDQQPSAKFGTKLLSEMQVLEVPSLGQRPDDLPSIIDARLRQLSEVGNPASLSKANREALQQRGWPGNLDELYEAMSYAVAIDKHSMRRAAEQVGIARTTLKRRMMKYGLK